VLFRQQGENCSHPNLSWEFTIVLAAGRITGLAA
jgi:hypothetical protein